MIFARTVEVGPEPYDLAANTGLSGVSISYLRNVADVPLALGERGDASALILQPGETLQGLTLGATDALHVWRLDGESGPVDLVIGWS